MIDPRLRFSWRALNDRLVALRAPFVEAERMDTSLYFALMATAR